MLFERGPEKHSEELQIDQNEEEQMEESDKDEEEYVLNDDAIEWQFQYNKPTCFSNDFPELDVNEDICNENEDKISEVHSVTPGEGQKPTHIFNEEDWDVKSFPLLHPYAQI